MSLLIHPGYVKAVLLTDGWHDVDRDEFDRDGDRYLFELDAYEFGVRYFNWDDEKLILYHGSGQDGICSLGFQFREGGSYITGPLTSIVAVKHEEIPAPAPDPNYVAHLARQRVQSEEVT